MWLTFTHKKKEETHYIIVFSSDKNIFIPTEKLSYHKAFMYF